MQIHSNRHTQSKWNFGLAGYSLWPETRPFPTQAQSATKRIQIQFDSFVAPGRKLETFSQRLDPYRTLTYCARSIYIRFNFSGREGILSPKVKSFAFPFDICLELLVRLPVGYVRLILIFPPATPQWPGVFCWRMNLVYPR